jgi:hypothetical protein
LLEGPVGLRCTDVADGWTVRDDVAPGTLTFRGGVDGAVPTLSATSADLLLWLYSRIDLAGDDAAMLAGDRLRELAYTN